MNSPSPEWAGFLSTLDKISGWTLWGIALASTLILFSPYTFGIDLKPIRQSYGGWLLVILVLCFALVGAKILRLIFTPKAKAKKNFILTPRPLQCWWHVARQGDGSYITQLVVDCDILNLTTNIMRFHSVRLISPKCKGEIVHADIGLFNKLKLGRDYTLPAHADWVRASLTVRQKLGRAAKPLKIVIGITDSLGIEQKIRLILRST